MKYARIVPPGALVIGMLLVLSSCTTGQQAVQRPPKATHQDGAAVRMPATGAWEGHQWRRLAWLDEDGRIAPGVLRTALDQREANMAAWAGSSRIAGIAPT
ncbi:MAG: hypothetical protein IT432_00080, partial [Phycisphaerales bacterium]|nr:hypothetical protein [Phycisphaerales bacterium]